MLKNQNAGVNVFQGLNKWFANFQFKTPKFKVTTRQKDRENDTLC